MSTGAGAGMSGAEVPSGPDPAMGINRPGGKGAGPERLPAGTDGALGCCVGALEYLVGLSAAVLGGAERFCCTVALEYHGSAVTVAGSDRRGWRVDEVQHALGEGPCLTALRTRRPVLVADIARDRRWPAYLPVVSGHGFGSILVLPLDGPAGGALNCYAREPNAFSGEAVEAASGCAAMTGRALALALRLEQENRRIADLQAVLQSRPIIDRAIGIIMAENTCSQEQAAAILKRASSTRNTKLREVAVSIVKNITESAHTVPCPSPQLFGPQ
jgi:GAF domain-containing protein